MTNELLSPSSIYFLKVEIENEDGEKYSCNKVAGLISTLQEFDPDKKTANYTITVNLYETYKTVKDYLNEVLSKFENIKSIKLYNRKFDKTKLDYVFTEEIFSEESDLKLKSVTRRFDPTFDETSMFVLTLESNINY